MALPRSETIVPTDLLSDLRKKGLRLYWGGGELTTSTTIGEFTRLGLSMKHLQRVTHSNIYGSTNRIHNRKNATQDQLEDLNRYSRSGCCSLCSLFLFLVNSLSISMTSFWKTSGTGFASLGRKREGTALIALQPLSEDGLQIQYIFQSPPSLLTIYIYILIS